MPAGVQPGVQHVPARPRRRPVPRPGQVLPHPHPGCGHGGVGRGLVRSTPGNRLLACDQLVQCTVSTWTARDSLWSARGVQLRCCNNEGLPYVTGISKLDCERRCDDEDPDKNSVAEAMINKPVQYNTGALSSVLPTYTSPSSPAHYISCFHHPFCFLPAIQM